MNLHYQLSLMVVALALGGAAHAQSTTDSKSSDAPPPIFNPAPPAPAGENELAPEVTITERGETTIKEYRVNNQLYMIEIIPKKGKPYYLVDTDGDGNMERRYNDLSPGFLIPSWVLLRWR